MVDFLEGFQRSAESCGHDFCVLSNIAVSLRVGMHGFQDIDIASIYIPALLLAKGCKRPLFPKLPPVALAVPECEMTFRAAREVASHLRLEERSQRAATIMLGGVACAEASSHTRFGATVESARTLRAVEGPKGA
jgi:hypothetical protein